MRFGSLFAGIGGFDLGLERAGMECAWQVEIDPYCQKVLAKHWPNVPRYSDVKEVGSHNLEPVELICGGFPCQDISIAGKGEGIAGKRSGLWAEYARIIGELRPSYVLVENVPMLVRRGLDRVLGDLATLGYDAEWHCIPAAAVGAPHKRDRIWIVAYPHGVGCEQETVFGRVVPDSDGLGPSPSEGRQDEQSGAVGTGEMADALGVGSQRCENGDGLHCAEGSRGHSQPPREGSGVGAVAHTDGEGLERRQEALQPQEGRNTVPRCLGTETGSTRRNWWSIEPDVGRVADGVPRRVERIKGLGNAVVPQVVEWIGRRIAQGW